MEVKGLTVEACEVYHPAPDHLDDGSYGWRVAFTATGLAIPVRFLRESDAIRAMRAISDLADWTLPIDELNEVVDKQAIVRTMTEALAW